LQIGFDTQESPPRRVSFLSIAWGEWVRSNPGDYRHHPPLVSAFGVLVGGTGSTIVPSGGIVNRIATTTRVSRSCRWGPEPQLPSWCGLNGDGRRRCGGSERRQRFVRRVPYRFFGGLIGQWSRPLFVIRFNYGPWGVQATLGPSGSI